MSIRKNELYVPPEKRHTTMRILLSYLFLVFLLPMSGYCQIGISPIGIGGGGSSLEIFGPDDATPGTLYTYTVMGGSSLTWLCTGCEFELGGSLPPSYGKWPWNSKVLAGNGYDPTFASPSRSDAAQEFADLIFSYRYDHRGRIIAKKIPGQDGEVRMVYDQLDRLVLAQDAKQQPRNEWSFTSYDALGRPVASGLCINGASHDALRAQLENTVAYEVFSGNDYGWTAFPFGDAGTSKVDLLTVTYYDSYDAVDLRRYDFRAVDAFSGNGHFEGKKDRVRGMLTATKVMPLSGEDWLWTVTHYDRKGRPVQIVADNHLYGMDVVSTLIHDFNGRTERTHLSHTVNSKTTEILKCFELDHAGRILQSYYSINGAPEQLLASFAYNELGEMVKKTLGDNLQQIDYGYNIRGWLESINQLELTAPQSGQPKDLWGMELSYDHGFEKNQFNGNIAGARWASARNEDIHAYGYQYDGLNRIKQADYRYSEDLQANWSRDKQDFTVFGIEYDANGNILKLNRQGAIGKNSEGDWLYGAMDRLDYTYEANRLIAVDDRAGTDGVAGDFTDLHSRYCSTSMAEYAYDANGSLTQDDNKGLSGMKYNHLNLPTEVTTEEGLVKYGYDAAGIKLWKQVWKGGVLEKRTDYVGEFVYLNGEIEFIGHEEGRFLPKKEETGYKSEFHYKDHLGNLRLSFREESVTRTATMEDAEEEEEFENWGETRVWANGIAGFAHTGISVAETDGANASRTMGPATAFKVEKGDVIKVTAYSRYENGGNFGTSNTPLPSIGAGTNFGLEGAGFLNNGLGIQFSRIMPGNGNFSRPQAYAIIRLLDKDGEEVYSESQLVENTAGSYQALSLELEVIQGDAEYAVVYVANESRMRIYFDDISIDHSRLVWQENSYYPFGMGIKPLDYEPEGSHRFTYNGKEEGRSYGISRIRAKRLRCPAGEIPQD